MINAGSIIEFISDNEILSIDLKRKFETGL